MTNTAHDLDKRLRQAIAIWKCGDSRMWCEVQIRYIDATTSAVDKDNNRLPPVPLWRCAITWGGITMAPVAHEDAPSPQEAFEMCAKRIADMIRGSATNAAWALDILTSAMATPPEQPPTQSAQHRQGDLSGAVASGDQSMLNKTHFKTLAGKPDAWDQEIEQRHAAGEGLADIQKDQAKRGRRIAVLFVCREKSSPATIRIFEQTCDRGLVPLLPRSIDIEEAIRWGKAWADEDPENREFYASREDLPESER